MKTVEKKRIIGVRHRIKFSAEGEARPTELVILEDGKIKKYNLPDDTAELDWVRGTYPTKMRKTELDENLSVFQAHHVVWRNLKKEERADDLPECLLRKDGKVWQLAIQVPAIYDGFQKGDKVVTILGGSGDKLSYALSRRGEEIMAEVWRVPPFTLKGWRDKGKFNKDVDAENVIKLFLEAPDKFYQVTPRDRQFIFLCKSLQSRADAMKARIACEQRLRQRFIGDVFCKDDGFYPEGDIENAFTDKQSSDKIYQSLLNEEKARDKELSKALLEINVFNELLAPIVGCGPAIASRILAGIQDVRRFPTDAKLKAYCGVHVLPDGRFPRNRKEGKPSNWKKEIRQALYLLGDQFNRRPESTWGKKLREYKVKLRDKHPEVIVKEENGKKAYTDAHIHRMATWRTLTKFVEWLWKEWWRLEKAQKA